MRVESKMQAVANESIQDTNGSPALKRLASAVRRAPGVRRFLRTLGRDSVPGHHFQSLADIEKSLLAAFGCNKFLTPRTNQHQGPPLDFTFVLPPVDFSQS